MKKMRNKKINQLKINLNSHILRFWMTFLTIKYINKNYRKDKKNDI